MGNTFTHPVCAIRGSTSRRQGSRLRPRERFFFEHFEAAEAGGYLLSAVRSADSAYRWPRCVRQQRRLAGRSAPTALALNMHLMVMGRRRLV